MHPGTGTDRQGFPAKLGASYPENRSLSAVFWRKVDPLVCPKCNGQMAVIAFIEDSDVIKKILKHLGLQPGPSKAIYLPETEAGVIVQPPRHQGAKTPRHQI